MSAQSADSKPFTIDDARKSLLIRSYMLTIETKLIGLLQTDDNGDDFRDAIARVRELMARLDEIESRYNLQPCRCYEGYECCNGICEVWCS